MKGKWINLLKILVSLVLMVLIFAFLVDVDQLILDLKRAHWEYLVAASILMTLGTALRAVRWWVLLRPLDIHIPISRLIYLYFVGAFFNLFLPTGMGGDVVKMVMLGKDTGKGPEAVGTTLVERATGLWVLFVLALFALPFSTHLLPLAWIVPIMAITVVGAVGGFIVMGTPLLPWLGTKIKLPGQDKLERFYNSVARLGYPALGQACAISLIFDISLIIFNILIALSLDVHQPVGIFVLFTPIISLSLALPISIAGLGVREGTYAALFSGLGVSNEIAVGMSLFNHVATNILVGVIGGILYAFTSFKELAIKEIRPTNK